MNVLLIHPRLSASRTVFRYALSFLRKALTPPSTNLLRIGVRLPAHWRKRLIDLNISRLSRTRLEWADCAIIHAHRSQRVSAWIAALWCRAKGLRVIGSGSAFHRWHRGLGVLHVFCQRPLSADWRHLCERPVRRRTFRPTMSHSPSDPGSWSPFGTRNYESIAIRWPRDLTAESDRPTSDLFRELDELESIAPTGWRGSIHLIPASAPTTKRQWGRSVTEALRAWRSRHGDVTFRAEIPLSLLSDREAIERLTDAGVTEAFVHIDADDLMSDSLTLGGRTRLVRWIKRAQRMGLQIAGGIPVLRRSGDWLEALWMASRIRALRLTKVMTCLLHAPLGRVHLVPALRSLFDGGIPWRKAVRILGIGARSLLTAPRSFSLALTLAVFSEHYGTACGETA